tara:strand:- start:9783 stop:10322 length:540 start_codon:yes stop_codon:yes gene_type:complete
MGKISKNKILVELVNKQKQEVENDKKLDVKSLQRISRNVEGSLFGDKCIIWQGYITYISSTDVHYINFFFNGKKHALHRLLYLNYIGDVKKNEYLKYTCPNKGKCCNINHIIKINSKKTLELEDSTCKSSLEEKNSEDNNINEVIKVSKDEKSEIITKNNIESNINVISDNKDKLIIIF